MKVKFSFNDKEVSVLITIEELAEDLMESNDFWGEFEQDGKDYQIQLYHSSGEVAIFEKGGSKPIKYADFIITYK